MNKEKVLWGIAVVGLVLAIASYFWTPIAYVNRSFGAVGNLLAENYIPYVQYNQGYNSLKGITLSGTASDSGLTISTTATSTYGSQGVVYYETRGGIDYADYQQTIAATSSVICIMPNPFGTATSTIVRHIVQVTSNGLAATQAIYTSTTTGTGGYGSSTPALIQNFITGAGEFTAVWQPNSATSTNSGIPTDLLPGMTDTGLSRYILGPSEYLTDRVATATPRTLDTYYTGTCSTTVSKP